MTLPPPVLHWYLPTHGDSATIAENTGSADSRASTHLEPTLANLVDLARSAEDLGFSSVLTPTGSHCEESWTTTAALAQHVERLRFLVAFRPGTLSPTLAAQKVATFQRLTGGRLNLNIVSGGDPVDQARYGDPLPPARRYDRTAEFLRVLRGIWREGTFSHHGEHYDVVDATTAYPAPSPTVYFSGSSAPGIAVAAELADVYLTWGEPPAAVGAKIAAVREAAAAHGRNLRFGVRLHTVARPTAEEAWASAEALLAGVTQEQVARAHARFAAAESEGQKRMAALTGGRLGDVRDLEVHPGLWAGPGLLRDGAGTAAVGSYGEVAALLREYQQVGVDEFILSGYPQHEEIVRVGTGVAPLLGADRPVAA
ncbi:LLM class flavin-dependent oxidoreductase [Nocardioides daeguensis]|uniref:LLM class flavin-dependent oxidoreductase n=1 Tax=Nocardioides daeguensis TaxID=908359 RepID=A0ABP6V4Q1_9ACTN|nr:LLM class flavin-dependent oxidoreductase [Nocardioides daeguensis]MBV6729682.1 LLM class flavin-dependent oxidoreductase [Nocardioides daeguensis]MCR1774713.1 LLM class flavin-dependent oxidoreductase [Nocardioides daeguensis]